MNILWSPWRLKYIMGTLKKPEGCVFCHAVEASTDAHRDLGVLYVGEHLNVLINRFPYNNGHVMVHPRRHIASFTEFTPAELQDVGRLIESCERILREVYHPHGVNVGVNIGAAAGAGIAEHLHVHLLPRWSGDTNFMTTTGETRVVPESSEGTWDRLRPHFDRLG